MKLCYSSRPYALYSWNYFEAKQKAFGIKNAELFGGTPHIWVDHIGYTIPEELKSSSLDLMMYTPKPYNYSFCAVDPDQIQKTSDYYRNCVDAAGELGIRELSVTLTGGCLDAPERAKHENAVSQLRSLASYAESRGINLHLAPSGRQAESEAFDLKSVCAILEETGAANVFAMPDITAMAGQGENPEQWADRLGDRIRSIRVSDTETLPEKYAEGISRMKSVSAVYVGLSSDDYWDDPGKWEALSLEHIRPVVEDIVI